MSDKTISPSVKDPEQDSSSSELRTTAYAITGPLQQRRSNWLNAMKSDAFKNSLIPYLLKQWTEGNCANNLNEKTVYAKCGDMCYSFKAVDGEVTRRTEPLLYSSHEETDSRMISI